MDIEKFKSNFRKHFKGTPLVVRSPGRINIIGEHTDYNEGFVLPAAIDKDVYVAVSKRNDEEIRLYAGAFEEAFNTEIPSLKIADKAWPNYILGVADQLIKRGHALGGFNLYIDGDVPFGAGLSSSAAVECAVAFALQHLFELEIGKTTLTEIAQQAEHTYAGVNCGIMDQFASAFGKEGHAIRLDCRDLSYTYFPLRLEGYQLVLLNTNVKHALADSAYNQRRAQCEQGVAWIAAHHPEVKSLRDATLTQLAQYVQPKDADTYTKCRFVVEEIERLHAGCACLEAGDLSGLGKKMFETHEGLSREYAVSCPELDCLVEAVKAYPEVAGARMMGGGFGGCTLNIIKEDRIEEVIAGVSAHYTAVTGLTLTAYIVNTANGTSLIE